MQPVYTPTQTQTSVREGATPEERGTPERTVVYSTGSRTIERVVGEDSVELSMLSYPIYPYGNYVKRTLRLVNDMLTLVEVRMNWNGTDSVHRGTVLLNEDEVKSVRELMLRVEEPGDFHDLVELFGRMLRRREEEFDRMVEELAQRFIDAYVYDRALRLDEETLRKLREDVEDYIREWLVE